jgi:hypothetical protein
MEPSILMEPLILMATAFFVLRIAQLVPHKAHVSDVFRVMIFARRRVIRMPSPLVPEKMPVECVSAALMATN